MFIFVVLIVLFVVLFEINDVYGSSLEVAYHHCGDLEYIDPLNLLYSSHCKYPKSKHHS